MQLTSHRVTHNLTPEKTQLLTYSNVATTTQHLVISADPGAHFPKVVMQNMMKHPLITINPDMNAISRLGDVVFPAQWCGIEYEGTAYRMDSVPITLKKVVEPPPGILTDEELLIRILAEVRVIKTKRGEPVEQTELKLFTKNLRRPEYVQFQQLNLKKQ